MHFSIESSSGCLFALTLIAAVLHAGVRGVCAELPGNRQFGSILNNDATNIMYAGTAADMTPNEYRKGVDHLLDAQPGDTAGFCSPISS
jgi:hypothetical protein